MICAALLHLLEHSVLTSMQIIICAGFKIVQVIVTASASWICCVSAHVSAIYPKQHKKAVNPTEKYSKIKISTSTFWLSIFGLTDLSGMLSTLAVLRLVHSPWQDMYELFNNYRESNLRFSSIACMRIHRVAHSLSLKFFFLGPCYSFISVIIVIRHVILSVWLSPEDGVGGKGCKEHGYAFPP